MSPSLGVTHICDPTILNLGLTQFGHQLGHPQTLCSGVCCSFEVLGQKSVLSYFIRSFRLSYILQFQHIHSCLYLFTIVFLSSMGLASSYILTLSHYFVRGLFLSSPPPSGLNSLSQSLITHSLHMSKPLQILSINYFFIFP